MASDRSSSAAPAWLTVDLGAVARNYKLIRGRVGESCVVAAVVKADSYGLGMRHIVPVLESHDCAAYIAATPDESLDVRGLTSKPVFALSGLFDGVESEFIAKNITPVLNSLSDIERWSTAAKKSGNRLACALHFDTGMNRLGLAAAETAQLLDNIHLIENIHVTHILSHFACADEQDNPMTRAQYDAFQAIARRFPRAVKSIANSSGIFAHADFHCGMVRPGQALYGLNPTPGRDNPVHPVVTLDARLLQVKTVRKGETVGYGASHKCKADTVIGTVALGYADGFLRALSSKGVLYYEGQECPVIGRVSMDLVTIALPGTAAKPGDRIEIIGQHQSADDLAAAAGTIGYEILTSLGGRYQRIYEN